MAKSVNMALADLDAVTARDRLAAGAITATDLVEACLARIAARDPAVEAWAFIDPDHARRQAETVDRHRASGRPIGPLHGLPVGVKDIIDTADMPTENGMVLDQGRRPVRDAVLVAHLRAAGAIIMGKTVTSEGASLHPGKTKNPHDPARTPGGSSSGSAAAVATGMVPLAVGTQTGGSVIRPASFCGVVGFKPSHGLIARTGVLQQSAELDTIGTFGRTVADAALLADVIAGFDAGDPDTRPAPPPALLAGAQRSAPVAPQLAFIKGPTWDQAEPVTVEAFTELAAELGDGCDTIDLPPVFAEGIVAQRKLMFTGLARTFGPYERKGSDTVSAALKACMAEARGYSALDWLAAKDWRDVLLAGLTQVFTRYDAIITPAAPGPAPGIETTGNPAFCSLWTFLGLPAITLPLLADENGLPMGVQVVGAPGDDARLLRTAAWLTARIETTTA